MNSLSLSLFPQERTSTSTAMKILIFFLSFSLISKLTTLLQITSAAAAAAAGTRDPAPTPWPPQFHSILYQNTTSKGSLAIIDLWYDWPNGRNLNMIQNQLGKLLYDLEWDNGTSYYYTDRDSNVRECKTIHFEVGILRPNWLDEAEYLGQEEVDGFVCNVWTKVDFIWYYEDVVTKRPVHWLFFTGMSIHVMTFEVGAVLEDEKWQAPLYCFQRGNSNSNSSKEEEVIMMMKGIDHQASSSSSSDYYGSLMRGWASPSSPSAAAA